MTIYKVFFIIWFLFELEFFVALVLGERNKFYDLDLCMGHFNILKCFMFHPFICLFYISTAFLFITLLSLILQVLRKTETNLKNHKKTELFFTIFFMVRLRNMFASACLTWDWYWWTYSLKSSYFSLLKCKIPSSDIIIADFKKNLGEDLIH